MHRPSPPAYNQGMDGSRAMQNREVKGRIRFPGVPNDPASVEPMIGQLEIGIFEITSLPTGPVPVEAMTVRFQGLAPLAIDCRPSGAERVAL